MGFDVSGNNNGNNVRSGNFNDRPAPDAYINLSLPRTDGQPGKVGQGIKLYFDKSGEQELANLLQTEEGIKQFREALIIQCNIVTGVEKPGFAIG